MSSIAVVILTFNEEQHIRRALDSVKAFASEVIIIDSHSTDRTVEISKDAGASIYQHRFVNQAKQFQWGLDTIEIQSDWILKLDADEVIEEDLANRIKEELPGLDEDVVGINLKRKHIFLGRWIKYGGRYPVTMLRLWRNGFGRVEDRWMDEHVVISGGKTITFDGGFSDWNLNDITFFINKHNSYATREAIQRLGQQYGLLKSDEGMSKEGASNSVARKRKLKDNFYNKLPFWVGPLFYFIYRYFFQLGFLDGREGLIYHFLQGFWYRFLIGAKIYEYERELKNISNSSARLKKLEEMSGFKLT